MVLVYVINIKYLALQLSFFQLIFLLHPFLQPLRSKENQNALQIYGNTFDANSFDWKVTKPLGLVHCCNVRAGGGQTCGKILSRCNGLVESFRAKIGPQICIFKIGVTSNPLLRFLSYIESGYQLMWLMHQSPSLDLIHMLEAALIMANCHHSGCRNSKGTGGAGGLNRSNKLPPPTLYISPGAKQTNLEEWDEKMWRHASLALANHASLHSLLCQLLHKL